MSGPQPDHELTLQGFFRWCEEAKSVGATSTASEENRPFIPMGRVKEYFQRPGQLAKILRAVYENADLPVQPELIQRKYSRVFCILLLAGKGKYIQHFVRFDSLCDQGLPFVAEPPHFPKATGDLEFFSSFNKHQWMFCAKVFHYDEINLHLERELILPIIRKEKLADGGSATTYKIALHESYNCLNPTVAEPDPSNPLANTFVLKTYYTKNAENYYESEVDAFVKLRWDRTPNPNMIGFYGSYIQDGSFNMLLEFADKGNLEQFFVANKPPSRGEDIVKFWSGMFGVIRALFKLHEVESNLFGGPNISKGWHQDIKPDNILVISGNAKLPYEWQFKLADLGSSHFRSQVSLGEENVDGDTHGTRTYGAPECYRSDSFIAKSRLGVRQNVDVWSLGGVYSEAATWVVCGLEGLQDYRRNRKLETDQIRGFRDGGCFHNGEKVLGVVQEWHVELLRKVRKSDFITGQVIDTMVKDMLGVSEGRPTAKQLWTKSQRILREAEDALKANTTNVPTPPAAQYYKPHQSPPAPWPRQPAPSFPLFPGQGQAVLPSADNFREGPKVLPSHSQTYSPKNAFGDEDPSTHTSIPQLDSQRLQVEGHSNMSRQIRRETVLGRSGEEDTMDHLNKYTQAMKKFYNLYAIWTPDRASRIKPGMCGYFDSQGDWNSIADILQIQDGDGDFTKLESTPEVQEKAQGKWLPIASEGVSWRRVLLAPAVTIPEANTKFRYSLDFESKKNHSAVLLTGPQVLEKYIEHPKAIFHPWCRLNYSSITDRFLDAKDHGLWIITKVFETPRCAISSWSGNRTSCSLYLGDGAFVNNSLTLGGILSERENCALWRFFPDGPIGGVGENLVVFIGGLRYADSWFGPREVPVATPLRGSGDIEDFSINRGGEHVEVACEDWDAEYRPRGYSQLMQAYMTRGRLGGDLSIA